MTDLISPLVEIERAVQARAKVISLDMATADAASKLRALIDDEVARWSDDYRRGRRDFDLSEPELVAERAERNLTGYGPLAPLLGDPDVWEIMINAPDQIFVKRHRGTSGYHDEVFHDDEHVVRTLTKILDDASSAHRKLDPTEGLQDAQLDDGARLHIVHGDVSRGGHIMVNIRKFTGVAFRSLDELVALDMLSPHAADFLRACVRGKMSIIFAGPPGSGKTTMLSCCAAELDPSLRVVIAEEVFEADVPLPNVASMQTRPPRLDRPAVDLRRLVAGFLRMAPDVAIVGEVRDREALPLLLTLSSGVKGFTTIHAGSARQALTRLRFICQLADTSNELPMSALNSLVSESIDIVVQCTRTAHGLRISEILAVEDLSSGPQSTQFTVTELFHRPGPDQPLQWTGHLPVRASRGMREAGFDVRDLLDPAGTAFNDEPAVMIGIVLALCAGLGVYYLYTAIVMKWRGLQLGPIEATDVAPKRAIYKDWLVQAGLADVKVSEFAAVMAGLFVLGAIGTFAIFGTPLPSLVMGGFAASFPLASSRSRRQAHRATAQEAWPRMIEEIRILTSSVGRSIPQALFEVGRRGPEELRQAFAAGQREWMISTDFERTIVVLKGQLADPTADAALETLLIAHELGGTDLDKRLEALVEDRILDTQGRKDARAKQSGVRFARRFVLLVPFGMALCGMSIGEGRDSYRTGTGQLLVLFAIAMVVACWVWAGRLMQLPEEERVFFE